MQIKFVRSGGFAGGATNVAGTVEFDDHGAHVSSERGGYRRELPPQEADQLRSAAEPAVLGGIKALSGPGAARDGYQYDVTVTTKDGKSHTFTLHDGSEEQLQKVAPAAAHLHAWIQDEAQKIWTHPQR